jgi:carbonic anhydrase
MSNTDLTRRNFLTVAGSLGFTSLIDPQQKCFASKPTSAMTTQVAISRLKLGNQRFVKGKPKHFRTNRAWRESLVSDQHPFAVILGCADSRVPTELIFDQGFDDLFVIRNAGNVVMNDVLGSIEYAALHLHTKLVVVMGHEGCGAVTAALKIREEREKEPAELQQILRLIDPAIVHLDPQAKNVIEQGVEANVRWSVKKMIRLQKQRNRDKETTVIGAVYNLKSGQVRFLDQPQPKIKKR